MNISRPAKGTSEYDLWVAAIDVAIAPPTANIKSTHACLVPWSRIERLRAALIENGVDWETAKRRGDDGPR